MEVIGNEKLFEGEAWLQHRLHFSGAGLVLSLDATLQPYSRCKIDPLLLRLKHLAHG